MRASASIAASLIKTACRAICSLAPGIVWCTQFITCILYAAGPLKKTYVITLLDIFPEGLLPRQGFGCRCYSTWLCA